MDGGKNHSSYKIKVEPQFITQNMIKNGTTVKAYVVNNNGDQIPYDTYSGNGYTFKYTTDTNSDFEEITGNTFIYTLSTGTPIFNEIKFNLECEGNLINQEIIEVLGENKFITSTEYINNTDSGVTFKITETANTYYNTTIIWGIEKSLDGVTHNTRNNTLIIQSGVTGTVILSGTCNNIKVYEKAIVITKNGEKGEQGETGETGPQGPQGKLLYPAGRWNSGTTYNGADSGKTPFVTYKVGDEDKYFVLTATTKISGTTYEPNKSGWTEMEQYEALYTKLLVAENGLVGGSVYNGDYVFSKDGTVNNTASTEYDKFLNTGLPLVDMIFSGDSEYHYYNTFIPNYLVDFNKGRAWFGNGETLINEKGVIHTKNLVEEIKTFILPFRGVKNNTTNQSMVNPSYKDIEWDSYSRVGSEYFFEKIVKDLNILAYPHEQVRGCPGEEYIARLKLCIQDESIIKQGEWYKGSIYLTPLCSMSIIDLSLYKDNRGDFTNQKITLYPGEKFEYLFKWDGGVSSVTYNYNSNIHTNSGGKSYGYKTGSIIPYSNDTIYYELSNTYNRIDDVTENVVLNGYCNNLISRINGRLNAISAALEYLTGKKIPTNFITPDISLDDLTNDVNIDVIDNEQ